MPVEFLTDDQAAAYGRFVDALPFGPKTYLPGISRRNGCIHVDFAW